MKIGIIGTRGIPNHHGGFEQFAEIFSVYANENGCDVYVYNSSSHPYKKDTFKGVNIIRCYDPEYAIGTIGQFIYDFNCIRDARKRNFNVILQLGYTSSSIWFWHMPKNSVVITNMDGLEWKRSKYSKKVQKFLKFAEKLAAKKSNYLIADSLAIKTYLRNTYDLDSKYIAYGATKYIDNSTQNFEYKELVAYNYFLLIARMEPENNIEMILDGYVKSKSSIPFCIIGNTDTTTFGRYLKKKYSARKEIKFLGGIYDLEVLNKLRYNSRLYFHGHSVGGTNPSLLEAMAACALVVAHNNEFNRAILQEDAFYFNTTSDISTIIKTKSKIESQDKIDNNLAKIDVQFNWSTINKKYLNFLNKCYNEIE